MTAYEKVLAHRGIAPGRSPRPADRGARTVLVTGIGAYWGGRVAEALERESSVDEILGMDMAGPLASFRRVEYIHMSLRSPYLADMLRHRRVDTVVHMEWREEERGRERMFETNVLGTRHLLSACRDARVRKVVVRSSTAVYGAHPENPNFIPERYAARARTGDPTIRDQVESESDFREFLADRGERPLLTVMRFAHIVGPTAPTPMNRSLARPELPAVLGFDPLLQLVHEDDAIGAVIAAVVRDVDGPVNVAADGVVPLSKAAALLGRRLAYAVLPLVPPVMRMVSYLPFSSRPLLPPEYLKFLCNGENRRMKTDLGFTPARTAIEILRALADERPARGDRPGREIPGYDEYVQRCLDEVLEPDRGGPRAEQARPRGA
jgi:UDP-glucose 4-epimerase